MIHGLGVVESGLTDIFSFALSSVPPRLEGVTKSEENWNSFLTRLYLPHHASVLSFKH
jgi:hypothetical protein